MTNGRSRVETIPDGITNVMKANITLMSKGIGHLQRMILTHLAEPIPSPIGGNYEGEITAYGRGFIPAEGVYDLRHVLQVVQLIEHPTKREAFQAAFSRATRSLLHRGLLERLWLVPIAVECWKWRNDPRWQVEDLADGRYLRWRDRQARFVRKTSSCDQILTANVASCQRT